MKIDAISLIVSMFCSSLPTVLKASKRGLEGVRKKKQDQNKRQRPKILLGYEGKGFYVASEDHIVDLLNVVIQ
jgi:hypothetical protein